MIWEAYWNLTVLKYLWHKYGSHRNYLCKCTCWKETEAIYQQLKNGTKKSCWCTRYKSVSEWNRTHWLSKTRIYKIWFMMKRRCKNKKEKNYCGRWISYCTGRETFENFYKDMAETYFDWATIDRIDNNWNYSKENCRRATYKQQANNKRNNRILTIQWEAKTIAERLMHFRLDWRTYYTRLRKWQDPVEAMTTPALKYHEKITHDWKSMSLSEWATYLWVEYKTLYRRIHIKHYPLEIALSRTKYDGKRVN